MRSRGPAHPSGRLLVRRTGCVPWAIRLEKNGARRPLFQLVELTRAGGRRPLLGCFRPLCRLCALAIRLGMTVHEPRSGRLLEQAEPRGWPVGPLRRFCTCRACAPGDPSGDDCGEPRIAACGSSGTKRITPLDFLAHRSPLSQRSTACAGASPSLSTHQCRRTAFGMFAPAMPRWGDGRRCGERKGRRGYRIVCRRSAAWSSGGGAVDSPSGRQKSMSGSAVSDSSGGVRHEAVRARRQECR